MKKLLSWILVMGLLLSMPKTSMAIKTTIPEIQRFAGGGRYETSVAISKEVFQQANNIVIASGENFPDGLTGGVLASVLNGPLLLSAKNQVPTVVMDEIKRLSPEKIYLLGGNASLSEKVEEQLSSITGIVRFQGKDRHETALKVAEKIQEIYPSKHLGLAGSSNFADSLASTALLLRNKIPLLLTPTNECPPNIQGFMKANASSLLLFGGLSQISNEIRAQLSKDFTLTSFSGANRYLTSYEIAKNGFSNTKTVLLTNGQDFPDALSASSLASKYGAPILLTSPENISKEILSLCAKADRVLIVGGESSVSKKIEEQILAFRNSSHHEILEINDVNEITINYYGKKERVRLIGVEIPTATNDKQQSQLKNQAFALLDRYIGKKVSLQMDIRQRDQQGRLLAYVYLNDNSRMLNAILLEEGYLVHRSTAPNIKHDDYLQEKEEEARDHKKGYWANN
ncbi:MAG: cell wall-binding repeat-containing protein [Tissierellia bacterium]|nr:cell wall-binding repeat-containing protein [Tissierellia bacterium]